MFPSLYTKVRFQVLLMNCLIKSYGNFLGKKAQAVLLKLANSTKTELPNLELTQRPVGIGSRSYPLGCDIKSVTWVQESTF